MSRQGAEEHTEAKKMQTEKLIGSRYRLDKGPIVCAR